MSNDIFDIIQPFSIESTNIRGRYVRLQKSITEIIEKHNYPDPVNYLLAQFMAATVSLGNMMKFDGIFTMQMQGEPELAAITSMVCDFTSHGDLRASVTYNQENLEKALKLHPVYIDKMISLFLQKGYIAFTVDQGPNTERYQGIVDLYGHTLPDIIKHYFNKSEQIDTSVEIHADMTNDPVSGARQWTAGSLILQKMPDGTHEDGQPIIIEPSNIPASTDRIDTDDPWERSNILLKTVTIDEITDSNLGTADLLFRLFHEDGIRIYESKKVQAKCRCSRERFINALRSIDIKELEQIATDNKILSDCEFCNARYEVDLSEL